jgi:hypothetical protein
VYKIQGRVTQAGRERKFGQSALVKTLDLPHGASALIHLASAASVPAAELLPLHRPVRCIRSNLQGDL